MKAARIAWLALAVFVSSGASAQVYSNDDGHRATGGESNRERVRREFREDLNRGGLSRDEQRLIELRRLQDRGVSRSRPATQNSVPANSARQPSGTVRQQ